MTEDEGEEAAEDDDDGAAEEADGTMSFSSFTAICQRDS